VAQRFSAAITNWVSIPALAAEGVDPIQETCPEARTGFINAIASLGPILQGLKPAFLAVRSGTAEAVPYSKPIHETSSCAPRRFATTALLFITLFSCSTWAAAIHGTVTDSLGAVVPNAAVLLIQGDKTVATSKTDGQGNYSLSVPAAGRYQVRATAASFQEIESAPVFVSATTDSRVDLTLFPGRLGQEVSVTATGTPVPLAQVGSAVAVLDSAQFPFAREVQAPLRLMPGLQLTQSGGAGAATSLFVRGGDSTANKVLLDGIPVNSVGGFADFGYVESAGVDRIEVLRGPNSALYGADALSGVVSVTTARGHTPAPLLSYSAEGGNFGTYRQDASMGGLFRQFDYFSEYDISQTSGSQPNNEYHYGNYAGNFGWTPNAATSLRITAHNFGDRTGVPGAVPEFGIADDTNQKNNNTFLGATLENRTTEHWLNLVRYGRTRERQIFTDPSPTGSYYDPCAPYPPACPEYLGNVVTLRGANGYSVTGQAILNYAGTYPSQTLETTNRDFVYAQSMYLVNPHLNLLGAFKYESERGLSSSSYSTTRVDRGNYSYTMQLAGDFRNRLYYTLGSGIENNAVFGVEATPRASLAYYVLRPSSGFFSGTKARFSFGKGIKEPSIGEQGSSLYEVLLGSAEGRAFIADHHIGPVGAVKSRSYDGGIDQEFANGRARASVTYFHNQFTDVVEYVPQSGLIQIGFPVGDFGTLYGAYVNSMSFRAQGVETELEYKVTRNLFVRGGATFLNAVVQHSFSSDALSPSYNPQFPTIPIGAYSPLRGQRPFRRAPTSGYFAIAYQQSRWMASLSGTLVGRRDDSTFLSDPNYGPNMLLPNRNLDPSYQRLQAGVSFRVNRYMSVYTLAENLLSQHYYEAFGYPSLPLTFRSGVRWTFGGESWGKK